MSGLTVAALAAAACQREAEPLAGLIYKKYENFENIFGPAWLKAEVAADSDARVYAVNPGTERDLVGRVFAHQPQTALGLNNFLKDTVKDETGKVWLTGLENGQRRELLTGELKVFALWFGRADLWVWGARNPLLVMAVRNEASGQNALMTVSEQDVRENLVRLGWDPRTGYEGEHDKLWALLKVKQLKDEESLTGIIIPPGRQETYLAEVYDRENQESRAILDDLQRLENNNQWWIAGVEQLRQLGLDYGEKVTVYGFRQNGGVWEALVKTGDVIADWQWVPAEIVQVQFKKEEISRRLTPEDIAPEEGLSRVEKELAQREAATMTAVYQDWAATMVGPTGTPTAVATVTPEAVMRPVTSTPTLIYPAFNPGPPPESAAAVEEEWPWWLWVLGGIGVTAALGGFIRIRQLWREEVGSELGSEETDWVGRAKKVLTKLRHDKQ